jgi:hypothetical protein
MADVLKIAATLAISLYLCSTIASHASRRSQPECSDIRLPINLRQSAIEHEFRQVKLVANAAIQTLVKEENESGQARVDGWRRLSGFLADFKHKHPEFRASQLDFFTQIAAEKSQ